jgi:hypothetical protein
MAAEQAAGWVKILADDYAATVSTRALLAQADSHLAQVIEPITQAGCAGAAARGIGCCLDVLTMLLLKHKSILGQRVLPMSFAFLWPLA